MTQKIAILGGGESGVGAAILAKKLEYQVFLSDIGSILPELVIELQENNIDFEQNTPHTTDRILSVQTIIISPGINPNRNAVVQAAKAQNIEIISEIEFATRHTTAKIIGITGTNGKSTTTELTYHILKKAGYNVGLAGNVGISLARQVATNNFDWYVVELSSYQLDGMYQTRVDIAIITNITPDHLDRYNNNIHAYQASKMRITQNQTAADALIYNPNDPLTAAAIYGQTAQLRAKSYTFATDDDAKTTAFIHQNKFRTEGAEFIFDLTKISKYLKGTHNVRNAMCATLAARLAGVPDGIIAEVLRDFEGVEHRQEWLITHEGIDYINDSKATNVDSTSPALEAQTQPIVWIAGGKEPEPPNDYAQLMGYVRQKVKAIVYLGTDNAHIKAAFASLNKPHSIARTMPDAVAQARLFATKGDVILLSPACKSFDLFKDFNDRGAQFKAAVAENN